MTKPKGKSKRPGSKQPRTKRNMRNQKRYDTNSGYASRLLFRELYFKGGGQ